MITELGRDVSNKGFSAKDPRVRKIYLIIQVQSDANTSDVSCDNF